MGVEVEMEMEVEEEVEEDEGEDEGEEGEEEERVNCGSPVAQLWSSCPLQLPGGRWGNRQV